MNAPSPESDFTILVVDDTEASRDVLARRLAFRGYHTLMAVDGEEALRMIDSQVFDLVLLDVMMPGVSGLDVLKEVRKTRSPLELPIIMQTARDQSEDIVAALELGANDYITKPLDFEVVIARVRTHVELARTVRRNRELETRLSQRNAELEAAVARTRRDLQAAAKVQAAFLPIRLPKTPGAHFAWRLIPCEELAGDSLNICRLDANRVGAYVLDVSGHGVAAALPAVAATRLLSASLDPETILLHSAGEPDAGEPLDPAEVAERLDRWFKSTPDTHQFITFFYFQIDLPKRQLTYVSAAHPPAVLVRRGKASLLCGSGLPIGLGDGYEQTSISLEPGDRVYLYSDGIPEAMNAAREPYTAEQMMLTLEKGAGLELDASLDALLDDIRRFNDGLRPHDDMSLLAMQCEPA